MSQRIYLETSHTARTGARTGIQTVVRGLAAGLSSRGESWEPVRWSFKADGPTPLKRKWARQLGLRGDGPLWLPPGSLLRPRFWPVWKDSLGMSYKTPLHRHPSHAGVLDEAWFLLPELMEGGHVRRVSDYAWRQGMRVAGIFHDAIAWRHPELVRHWSRDQHRDYMEAFSHLDAVVAVSAQAAEDFRAFVRSQGLREPRLAVCPLAAEVPGQRREVGPVDLSPGPVRILCVSTLEPRKNHRRLIEAFMLAASRGGAERMELHLVGAEHPDAPEIAAFVREKAAHQPSIIWHGQVDAATLRDLYRACTFTLFGSWIEGFGLPVLESLWFGKPCLCADTGVIAENAAAGGCLTVDVANVEALAEGMVRLAGRTDFREELGRQARRRPLKTWEDYAGEMVRLLQEPAGADRSRPDAG